MTTWFDIFPNWQWLVMRRENGETIDMMLFPHRYMAEQVANANNRQNPSNHYWAKRREVQS